MPVTVYFATNRKLTGAGESLASYRSTELVAPSNPALVTFGTAFVNDANLTADTTGAIQSIQNISHGDFDDSTRGDLETPGRNLLIFIHGFDNSFENAITRAAFNQQWLLNSGLPGTDTSVIAFCWPSLGKLLSFPILDADYKQDQTSARLSGLHIMSFFAALEPTLAKARKAGAKVTLLAHSMGNWALAAAVENWFAHGNGVASLFDEAILAAADEVYDTFDYLPYGRLSGLSNLARRISIYFSNADAVLKISMVVNLGANRLGQDGPHNRFDTGRFPPSRYRMVDCSGFHDYQIDFASSHQYYRRSPAVRADIAAVMATG